MAENAPLVVREFRITVSDEKIVQNNKYRKGDSCGNNKTDGNGLISLRTK